MAKICRHCGEQLEPVTFYIHHRLKHGLDWLVENRKATTNHQGTGGPEQDLDEVLDRLIRLELTKRSNIEDKKDARAKRQKGG